MIKQINLHDFREAFRQSDERRNQFSYGALEAIFDFYESIEDDTSEPIELDIIATCCEFTEYDSAYEAMQNYQPEDMPIEGEPGDDLLEIAAKNEKAAIEWLQDRTIVLHAENFDMSTGSSALDTPMLKSIVVAQF